MCSRIKHQDCRITITHGLDEQGDMIFDVDLDGDMPYVYTLGLIEAAKDNLKEIFEVDK